MAKKVPKFPFDDLNNVTNLKEEEEEKKKILKFQYFRREDCTIRREILKTMFRRIKSVELREVGMYDNTTIWRL